MRCGDVNELLGIALPLILTGNRGVMIMCWKFGKLYFPDQMVIMETIQLC